MRCYLCHCLSLCAFCKRCKKKLLKPHLKERYLGELKVISFYPYEEISSLLHTKHTPKGYRIYKALGALTLRPFMEAFGRFSTSQVTLLGIDEHIFHGYSHVALLTHSVQKNRCVVVKHSCLLSQNRVTYAGKNLQFRRDNPRDFIYNGACDIDAILVDDIVTTGTTLKEAEKCLRQKGVNLLFALTLADVAQ